MTVQPSVKPTKQELDPIVEKDSKIQIISQKVKSAVSCAFQALYNFFHTLLSKIFPCCFSTSDEEDWDTDVDPGARDLESSERNVQIQLQNLSKNQEQTQSSASPSSSSKPKEELPEEHCSSPIINKEKLKQSSEERDAPSSDSDSESGSSTPKSVESIPMKVSTSHKNNSPSITQQTTQEEEKAADTKFDLAEWTATNLALKFQNRRQNIHVRPEGKDTLKESETMKLLFQENAKKILAETAKKPEHARTTSISNSPFADKDN